MPNIRPDILYLAFRLAGYLAKTVPVFATGTSLIVKKFYPQYSGKVRTIRDTNK
jgi:hypothetical protein